MKLGGLWRAIRALATLRPLLRLVGVKDKTTVAKVAEAADKLEPLLPPESPPK